MIIYFYLGYVVKLLKTLKIPFGTDRSLNGRLRKILNLINYDVIIWGQTGVDTDPTVSLVSHIIDCLGALRDVNKVIMRKKLTFTYAVPYSTIS
jgi:hypothetical protein